VSADDGVFWPKWVVIVIDGCLLLHCLLLSWQKEHRLKLGCWGRHLVKERGIDSS